MLDYTAANLLTDAKERYGEQLLQSRMAGSLADTDKADAELLEIAEGVFNRVRTAAARTISWPFAGSDDAGTPYSQKWPRNTFQRALELFNFRTQATLTAISPEELRLGIAAEKYFDSLEAGVLSWGIGGTADLGSASLLSARDRDGTSFVGGTDIETMHDTFVGRAWNG